MRHQRWKVFPRTSLKQKLDNMHLQFQIQEIWQILNSKNILENLALLIMELIIQKCKMGELFMENI